MHKHEREFVKDFNRGVQTYQSRVEVVIQGMARLIAALGHLNRFLLEQQGPEWDRLDSLVRSALKEIKVSKRWLVQATHSKPKCKRRKR